MTSLNRTASPTFTASSSRRRPVGPPAPVQQPQPPVPQLPPPSEVMQTVVAPGPLPTVQHHNVGRPSLSQRLSGDG
ncbi:hypothetical protein Lesp02_78960 [Lentzea sp. NBRC 105346]|nr:hypothetical protein Lesp02_78960 [Lentzea sp. NBRC 105346]